MDPGLALGNKLVEFLLQGLQTSPVVGPGLELGTWLGEGPGLGLVISLTGDQSLILRIKPLMKGLGLELLSRLVEGPSQVLRISPVEDPGQILGIKLVEGS
jgi:hypothetical protein